MLPNFSLQLHISGAVSDNTDYCWGNNGSKRKATALGNKLFHLQSLFGSPFPFTEKVEKQIIGTISLTNSSTKKTLIISLYNIKFIYCICNKLNRIILQAE
jgi:ribosome biogenesis protein Nip4